MEDEEEGNEKASKGEREREEEERREKKGEKERGRETESERDRERETERHRERQREREKKAEKEGHVGRLIPIPRDALVSSPPSTRVRIKVKFQIHSQIRPMIESSSASIRRI